MAKGTLMTVKECVKSWPNDWELVEETTETLPEGWMDWNTLTLDQMVEHLRNKYRFSSSGDAKCIFHLIEFYDKHKQ
jgi:hypothetical protein